MKSEFDKRELNLEFTLIPIFRAIARLYSIVWNLMRI